MAKEVELSGSVVLDLSQSPKTPADLATFTATAKALQVVDDTSYQIAVEMCQREARWGAEVDAFYEKGRVAAHSAWRWFTGNISKHKDAYQARAFLEPRMLAYRKKQADEKRAAELNLQREAEAAQRRADEESRAIAAKATAEAMALRRQGEMSAANAVVAQAQEQVAQVQEASSIGVILPDTKPQVAGVSESQPWVGEVLDIKRICLAIGKGEIPLEYLTPVFVPLDPNDSTGPTRRKKQDRMTPLVVVDQAVLDNLAKRLGKEDLGIPGARGTRGMSLRISKSDTPGW